MPIASIACLPRRGWTASRVYLPARAQWISAFREPVIMSTTKARRELRWRPRHDALQTLRETISAALTLLVVVASAAISLLRVLLSVRRLALLPATGDEGRKAVDVAVVLGWATLLRRRPALLLREKSYRQH